uniref:LOW QUALITY PROTEIN: protein TNT n=1 Tax=Castor canadensis TaxID=51338 RepID=A0A8B7W0V1_CASCN
PQPTFRGLPGPLLDKQLPLPPTGLEAGKGGSSAWDVQEQVPNLLSLNLELQPRTRPRHTAATREPLKASCSTLGPPRSSSSLVQSPQHPKPEEQSKTSLLSSGYVGDEERSDTSLVDKGRILRLSKRPDPQVDSAQSSQLCAAYFPSQLKNRRLDSQHHGTQQTGGQNRGLSQASSNQSIRVDGNGQGVPNSDTNLQGDKPEGAVKTGNQMAQDQQPAQ